MILKPRPYQLQAIEAVTDAWKSGMLRPAVVLPTGAGKGHPLDTEVVTPSGLRLWGDLKEGDLLYGSDGYPTRITGIFDRGLQPSYRVYFSDRQSVTVDGDHLWSVRDDTLRGTSREWGVKSTREIMSLGLRNGVSWRWRIPVSPTMGTTSDLPVSPYTLGALIANGHLARSSSVLTSPDEEVLDRVSREHSFTRHKVDESRWCPRGSVTGGVAKSIRELGLNVRSDSKFIPRIYLESSYNQRLDLFHGLMDGDGSSRPGRRSLYYSTTSSRLAEDMVELVNSLGGTASISCKDRIRSNGKTYSDIRVSILLPSDVEPFFSSRKVQTEYPRKVFEPKRSIVSIEPVGFKHIRCVSVESPDSLYQVTRNRIVTHNTVTFAHLIAGQSDRALVLVHRDELARQALDKIRSVAPDLDVGLVKAESNDVDADVIVASVQTLVNDNRMEQISGIGVVIVDEAHHATAPSYKKVLSDLGCWEDTRCVGFTATMSRSDDRGLGDVWEDVVYHKDIMWGIINGFLVDVEAQTIEIEGLDLGSVARSRGDYQEGQLGEALEASGAGPVIARAYKDHAGDKQGILFTPTVATAYAFADDLADQGIVTEVVTGETPVEERQAIFERYRNKETQVLANCMVLTEGFDMPQAEVALIARPTSSQSLFVQMAGRVLRPFPGKEKALILDVVGLRSMNLRSIVDLSETEIEPRPGKSLKEMYELDIEEEERVERDVLEGTTTTKVRKLFDASSSVWLKTHGGTWFVPTKDGYVFLWPEGGRFKIGKTGDQYSMKGGGWLKEEPLDLPYAMAWAEQFAEELDPTVASRAASWRKKKQKPSDAQKALATRLKIPYTEATRKNDLSDKISVYYASKVLDR